MSNREDLTVAEALKAVLDGVPVLSAEAVPILDALNRVLAESVVAADSLPPFANSSMDGYAVRADDVATACSQTPATLLVVGDIAAGSVPTVTIDSREAARIMTGAPLPPGADAVVPVEDTNERWRDGERPLSSHIQISRAVQPGDYVRGIGEDIQAGQIVLAQGHILRPQEIGVLASLGISHVRVIRRPRVAILATGDELLPVEAALQPGKIRNSNGYAQTSQVQALGADPIFLGIARDTEEDVRDKLQ
ncbi:MAG: molybdopterin molybdotransferase MoeA, partial [Anaerolineae bacterium]|nr:molybdopterin molybdotransferase MoeA [Anaerolineae bacterium]